MSPATLPAGKQARPRDALRLRLTIRGAVQGVGFRPFVYRLATELGLAGWVQNSLQGVDLEIEGSRTRVEEFSSRLCVEKPPLAEIEGVESAEVPSRGGESFEIHPSAARGEREALILPDIATCPECVREIFDAGNRRYRYPFTNCTHCGPRFSILQALPYDRPNTTMKKFAMCPACLAEYEDPADRRFHAQPNACPQCGPHVELWDLQGGVMAARHEALLEAAAAIRSGDIVALKGLGGFHLLADARNEEAVQELRRRKQREEKPFALMYPSLERLAEDGAVSELERRLLASPEAPIVLVRRREPPGGVARAVAPGNPYLGAMLPYTPLHHLLLAELGFPIVATSGNRADEPICTEEREALQRLAGIADCFLVHNRPIARHVDDSVACVMGGREMLVRRARGYAPLPVHLATSNARGAGASVLAVGAHLKNTVALAAGHRVFLSQHIGDLETPEALGAFERVIEDFQRMQEVQPAAVACDAHPDYLSTRYAQGAGTTVIPVQHHVAHVAACLAENEVEGPVLGVSWDGTGYGPDRTIWGGEFLHVNGAAWRRVAHLRNFPLPGGEAAVKEPRRAALGLLYDTMGEAAFELPRCAPLEAFSPTELRVLRTMLKRGVNCPLTSSAGRLFDAVAAILGIRQRCSFEGQAAMELEFAAGARPTSEGYDFGVLQAEEGGRPVLVADWQHLIRAMLQDAASGVPTGLMAAKFHNALVELIVAVARQAGEPRVALTGGCFQNRYLTEQAVARLRAEGFLPLWHRRVPPNDGGIALGQVRMALSSQQRGGV